MPPEVARTEVFRRHALTGFVPSVPHIRYPVTIGLYEEGENLGLFLAPIDLALARLLTGIADDDRALVLHGPAVMDDAYLTAESEPDWLAWSQLDNLSGDVDAIHFPERARVRADLLDIRTPILAAPEHAVPTEYGSRVAIGFSDGMVGIWSRRTGQRIVSTRLHGAIHDIEFTDKDLIVLSELGDVLRWDVSALNAPGCDVLRSMWADVSVVWRDGQAQIQAPPKAHACAYSAQ